MITTSTVEYLLINMRTINNNNNNNKMKKKMSLNIINFGIHSDN